MRAERCKALGRAFQASLNGLVIQIAPAADLDVGLTASLLDGLCDSLSGLAASIEPHSIGTDLTYVDSLRERLLGAPHVLDDYVSVHDFFSHRTVEEV